MTDWLGWATLSWVLNTICQGLAVAGTVWLLLRVSPRTNAATRYAVWSAALVAVLALPLVAPPAGMADGVASSAAAPQIETGLVKLPAPGAWPVWLLAAWGIAAALKLASVAGSYLSMQRLKRRSMAIVPELQQRFANLVDGLGVRRAPVLRVSREVAVPMAAGLHRPAVVLPEALPGRLSPEELDQVLVHELAHLRRGDDWTNLVQKLIQAVLVFHPAVWWIGRHLNIERELACDDRVVALTGRARPYAACLTKLAELRLLARHPQLAPGAVARKRHISERIESLLDGRRNTSPRFAKGLLAITSCAVALATGAAGRFRPVVVSEPSLAALPAGGPAAARPVQAAYALPPKPVEAPARPAVRHDAVLARAVFPGRATYVLVQQWRIGGDANVKTSYCILYFEGDVPGWLRILWVPRTTPRPVLKRT